MSKRIQGGHGSVTQITTNKSGVGMDTAILLTPALETVHVTRRKTNKSKVVLITVNKDTQVFVDGKLV